MKIYYSNEIFYRQKKGGISRYFYNLFSSLNESNIDINIEQSKKNNSIKNAWNIYGLQMYNTKFLKKYQIFHETYYNLKAIDSNIKKVTTIHDMTYEKYPKFFKMHDLTKFHKKIAIHRCDLIICVSENTKKDLLEIYPKVSDKIQVIYPIIKKPKKLNIEFEFEFKFPYFLYVGNRRSYKNVKILFEAFAKIQKKYSDLKVIFVGGETVNSFETTLIQKFKLRSDSIIFLSADDILLQKLYENAISLIITSIYEGFGFTGIEAMLNNCRVISSKHDVAREVLGKYAEYFEFNDSEQLSHLMEFYLIQNRDIAKLNEIKVLTQEKFTSKYQVLKYISAYKSLIL